MYGLVFHLNLITYLTLLLGNGDIHIKISKDIEEVFEEQNNYCHIWIDGGNIILWDSCPKAFHKSWLHIKRNSQNSWNCPYWSGEWERNWSICETDQIKQPKPWKKTKRGRPRKIQKISEDEEMVVESFNKSSQYLNKSPKIEWPLCKCYTHLSCIEIPLWLVKNNSNKLLSVWKWWTESREIESFIDFSERVRKKSDKEAHPPYDHKKKKNYLYLVKLNKTSYYHWVWVSFEIAQELSKTSHNSFLKKWRELERGGDEDNKEEDLKELRLNRYINNYKGMSFPSSYTEIDKIIGGKTFHGKLLKYFVKWKDLDYDWWTWEYPDFIETIAPLEFRAYRKIVSYRNKLLTRSYVNELIQHHQKPRNCHFDQITSQPKYITEGMLKEHQIEGLNWLYSWWHNGNNAILADEKGLGKTIQTVAFFQYLMNIELITRPFLIITDHSNIPRWERELKKWIPDVNMVIFKGSAISRRIIELNELTFGRPIKNTFPKFNFILTTFDIIWEESKYLVTV